MISRPITEEDINKFKEYIHAKYSKLIISRYSEHTIKNFGTHEQLLNLISALFDLEPSSFLKFFFTVGPNQNDDLGLSYSEHQELANLDTMPSIDHQLDLICSIEQKENESRILQEYVCTLVNRIIMDYKSNILPLFILDHEIKYENTFELLQSIHITPYEFFSWAKAQQFSLPNVIEQKLKAYQEILKSVPTSGLALVFRDEESCKRALIREVEYLLSKEKPAAKTAKVKNEYAELLYIGLKSLQGTGLRAIGQSGSEYLIHTSEQKVSEKLKIFHDVIFSLYDLDSSRFSPKSPTKMAKGKTAKGEKL
ncbi:MAG: hypothetical protein R3Y11_02535 [Pseudomonadota bacterium]